MSKVTDILRAKADAGDESFLWLHSSGDCILWPNEDVSINDDGRNAIERWQLDTAEIAELEESGEIDQQD